MSAHLLVEFHTLQEVLNYFLRACFLVVTVISL